MNAVAETLIDFAKEAVGLPKAWIPKARVEAVIRETRDATTLVLRPDRAWPTHRAGQFVKIGVEVDGRILTRTYSISSSPHRDDACFTITVKAHPNGRVSRKLAQMSRGEHVRIARPQGDFVLPEVLPPRMLFVTGGSGVTPVMSMLRSLSEKSSIPDIAHVHYERASDDIIFGRELRRLFLQAPRYALSIVETRRCGKHLDRESLTALVPDFASRETWACGPESLLDAVETITPAKLHVERFRAKFKPISDQGRVRVRFGRSKKEVDAMASGPLLEVAERAGIDAAHGCRIGICHSCDVTLLSGCVRDLRTGETIDEAGTRIQPCVCAAVDSAEIDL